MRQPEVEFLQQIGDFIRFRIVILLLKITISEKKERFKNDIFRKIANYTKK